MQIVLDVGQYPTFLKWVTSARATWSGQNELDADVLVGHRLFTAPISARLVRSRPGRVDIRYRRGPIRDFSSTWTVEPLSEAIDVSRACTVRVVVDIQPGLLLSPIVNSVLDLGLARLVESFEARAHKLYGHAEGGAPMTSIPPDRSPRHPDDFP